MWHEYPWRGPPTLPLAQHKQLCPGKGPPLKQVHPPQKNPMSHSSVTTAPRTNKPEKKSDNSFILVYRFSTVGFNLLHIIAPKILQLLRKKDFRYMLKQMGRYIWVLGEKAKTFSLIWNFTTIFLQLSRLNAVLLRPKWRLNEKAKTYNLSKGYIWDWSGCSWGKVRWLKTLTLFFVLSKYC